MGRKTPPAKTPPARNCKRNERPSSSPGNGEEKRSSESRFDPLEGKVIQESNTGRDRSLSKRRKTVDQQQQKKITCFTSNQDNNRNEIAGGETDIVSDRDRQSASLMDILSRMETGMEDNRKQNDKVSFQLDQILSEIFDIKKENDALKKKLEALERSHSDLRDDVGRLQKELRKEKESRNLLEQYTRKDNIKIINLPGDTDRETSEETEEKVVQLMMKQLQLTSFQRDYISVAHRVGKFTPGKHRAVIVRLVNRKIKTDIFKRRRILKQNKINIFISEDLTQTNAQRLYQIKHHPGVLSAWPFQGKLYCKLLDLKIITIEDGDIDKIDRMLLETTTSVSTPHNHRLPQRPVNRGTTGHREGHVQDRRESSHRPARSTPPAPGTQRRLHLTEGTTAEEGQPTNNQQDQTTDVSEAAPPTRPSGSVAEHSGGARGGALPSTASAHRQHGQPHHQLDAVPATISDARSEMFARTDVDGCNSGLENMEVFEDRPSPPPHPFGLSE